MDMNGKHVVLTGVPSGQRSRKDIEANLRRQGARIDNKISSITDLLIYGRSNTVKYRDAISRGIRVMTYDEFFNAPSGSVSNEATQDEAAKKEAAAKTRKKKFTSLRKQLDNVQTASAGW